MFSKLVFSGLVAATSAHLCNLSPVQRDGVPSPLTQANPACFGTSECTASEAGKPVAEYYPGQSTNIVFQKNLDHYNATNPGTWTISFQENPSANKHVLAKVPDTATPSLTVFSVNVTLPKVDATDAVIEVVYDPNMPEGLIFHSCSDIRMH